MIYTHALQTTTTNYAKFDGQVGEESRPDYESRGKGLDIIPDAPPEAKQKKSGSTKGERTADCLCRVDKKERDRKNTIGGGGK